jgi:hypothetical protein
MDYNNYLPKKRLPYAVRIRNRIIVFSVFMGLCALLGTCIFGENAIKKCKEIRTRLRIYSLDNMRNVVHSSSTEELAKEELSNFISI